MDAGERLTHQTPMGTILNGMRMAAEQTVPITPKFACLGVTEISILRNKTMKDLIEVIKDENKERPVPSEWRPTFFRIVEAFKAGDFKLENEIPNVQPLSDGEAQRIEGNIRAYGSELICLPEESWDTSVYIWMGEYWEVLVDLFVSESLSDLVLFTRVYERGLVYEFDVESVHVP
jgi:hypothetical protein